MSMIVKMVKTSPEWVGKNWKTVLSLAGFLWTVIVFLSTWFAAVNATVTKVPQLERDLSEISKTQGTVVGKLDVLITLEGYRIQGQRTEARDYLQNLPKTMVPSNP